RDPDRRVRRVHALPPGTARTINVDLKVILSDLYLHLLSLRKHRYRSGRGVDTALALSLWYTLNPVSATLVLEHRIGTITFDLNYNLFVASNLGGVRGEGTVLEVEAVGVASVHLVELASEEG